jgi:hypothetical protein
LDILDRVIAVNIKIVRQVSDRQLAPRLIRELRKSIILPLLFAAFICLSFGCRTITYLTVLNEQDRLELQRHNVPSSLYEQMVLREPLSAKEVAVLSKCQVSTEFVIRYLDTSGRSYQLTDEDVVWLTKEGVDQALINHLKEVHPPFATRVLQGIGSAFVGK